MSIQGGVMSHTAPKITQQWIECQQECTNRIAFFNYQLEWNATVENYDEYPDTSSNDNSYVVETLYVDGQPFEEFNRARDLNYCKVRCLDNYLIAICKKYRLGSTHFKKGNRSKIVNDQLKRICAKVTLPSSIS
ncbi:Oidioi.mRNA.OKI2018_I69.PAR.g12189.t1.cds [Oikopleura dioica]|uniref:Oidioi.mRNA.OKI2018_I69.PAR.g12189.t1.cds n=1 Tax=Oikopleura dioica TaxID=34765 RepID=A0ABN7S5A7_OIKDI|nr:Oidioi.mRNA.OKI2018_I69.PAR.g12189.t1.cds [Oikopleura dioica]